MTHNHEAQAAALQKLQELITAIAEATKALPRVLPPQPTQTPRDIERRIVEAVTARERISFGDFMRDLLYAYDRRRLPDDLDSPGPAPAEAVGSATAGALGEHTEQDDTPI
jgi:hypothetical protein